MPPKKKKYSNGNHGLAALGAKIQKALRAEPPNKKPELPYPRSLLKAAEARAGYVAVYVVGPRSQAWPISFGVTSDPSACYHSYQKGYWEEQAIHELQWTPGRPAAERIKRAMLDMLQHHRKFFWRGWFDVTADEAKIALIASARQEGIQLFDDVEKQRRLHRIAQKAWEAKVGVETIDLQPEKKPSAVILQLPPNTKRH